MVSAITKEMDARGYEKSDDPDLLVNFNAVLRDKTKVTTRQAPVSCRGYYGYRGGYYDPWFGYSHSVGMYDPLGHFVYFESHGGFSYESGRKRNTAQATSSRARS